MVSLCDVVTHARFLYHLNAIDVNNVLNQLRLRSDKKADKRAAEHLTVIVDDILPRLGYDSEKVFSNVINFLNQE